MSKKPPIIKSSASVSGATNVSANKSWKRRALGKIFNRRTAALAFGAVLVTDLYGYAGAGGDSLLRTFGAAGAAPYYKGLGYVMNFSWEQMKSFGRDVDALVKRHSSP